MTTTGGSYLLTLDAAGSGISDAVGNPLSADVTDEFVVDLVAPTADIVDVVPDPGMTVGAVTIDFDEPVTGFDLNDLSLTRDGNSVDLSAVPFSAISAAQFEIDLSSVTSVSGNYVLNLAASTSGISDSAGNALAADASGRFCRRYERAGC